MYNASNEFKRKLQSPVTLTKTKPLISQFLKHHPSINEIVNEKHDDVHSIYVIRFVYLGLGDK